MQLITRRGSLTDLILGVEDLPTQFFQDLTRLVRSLSATPIPTTPTSVFSDRSLCKEISDLLLDYFLEEPWYQKLALSNKNKIFFASTRISSMNKEEHREEDLVFHLGPCLGWAEYRDQHLGL